MKLRVLCLFTVCGFILSLQAYAYESKKVIAHQNAPFLFIANKGQVTDQYQQPRTDIDYKLQAADINVFIGKGQIHYQWSKGINQQQANSMSTLQFDMYRLDVTLVGANVNAKPEEENPGDYWERFYNEQSPGGVVASACGKIIYKDIYPHIDWVLYTEQNGTNAGLKYDFIIHAGGNAGDIRLRYDGATALTKQEGAIKITTPYGNILEHAPYSYNAETREKVSSAFRLQDNILSFNIAEQNGTIVIDPVVDWATYFGGTAIESGYTLNIDAAGNVYMGGSTISNANIATTGAYQTSYAGAQDAFLAKYSITGAKLWVTYYGGSGADDFFSGAMDGSGNLFLAGITYSTSGIASGGYQTTYGGGGGDAYLVKFNAAGARIWSTYYGGSDAEQSSTDYQVAVACDGSGNVYLGGNTTSTGMASNTAHQNTLAGNMDGFLAKFSGSGSLLWSTYYGGNNTDKIVKLAADASGNIFAYGETSSSTGIATSSMYQSSLAGASDVFIAKFNSSGVRQWATYYGGTDNDNAEGFCVDASGNIYISGTTQSSNGIATTGSYQSSPSSGVDAFLARFSNTATLQWGTYYGGNNIDHSADLAFDGAGNICMTGSTASTTGIATVKSYQEASGGSFDAYMSIFTSGGVCTWASYFGGVNNDYGYGIKCNSNGDVHMTGYSNSINLASSNANQITLSGAQDAILVKLKIDTSAYVKQPFTATTLCGGDTLTISYEVTNPHRAGNTFIAQLSSATGSFASPVTIGTITGTLAGQVFCTIPANAAGVGYRIRIVSTMPATDPVNNGNNITIKLKPANLTVSGSGAVCSGNPVNLYSASTTTGVSYSWTGPGSYTSANQNPVITNSTVAGSGYYKVKVSLSGCFAADSVNVLVKQTPAKPVSTYNNPCTGNTLILSSSTATPGSDISWTGPASFSSAFSKDSVTNVTLTAEGKYIAKATLNGCSSSDTLNVVLKLTPVAPVINSNSPLCEGDTIKLSGTSSTPGASYAWTGPASYTSSGQNPFMSNSTVANSGYYKVLVSLNGCTASDSVNVLVKQTPAKPSAGSNSPVCEGDTLKLSGTSATSGVSYTWSGPNFNASQANAEYLNIPVSGTGNYKIKAMLNGCTAENTTTIVVTPVPAIPVTGNNGPICTGEILHLTAASATAGVSYVWTGPGSYTALTQNPTINNVSATDAGYYKVAAHINGCYSKPDSTLVIINLSLQPSVQVNVTPGTTVGPLTNVQFKAGPMNGGTTPAYQWIKDGTDLPGVTGDTYTAKAGIDFTDNTQICVRMSTSAACISPDTATGCAAAMHIDLDVNKITSPAQISLYPNPNNGQFTLHIPPGTYLPNTLLEIEIINAIGQTVYGRNIVTGNNGAIEQVSIPNMAQGVYCLKIKGNATVLKRFIINH